MSRLRSSSVLRPSHSSPVLGSLTQPGARGGVACRACGSVRVTRIAMALTDGSPVEFTSCHHCDHRGWTEDGQPLQVDRVLDKARKLTPQPAR